MDIDPGGEWSIIGGCGEIMEAKVDIFGSCISRDILDVDANEKTSPIVILHPGHYIARQSFVSAMMPSATVDSEAIHLESTFQKRVVSWDIEKKAFDVLRKEPADYLIVDFFEERFNLVCYKNTVATYSNEFRRAELESGRRCAWYSLSESIDGRSFLELFDAFVSRLLEIYDKNAIILNKAFLCDAYIGLDGKVQRFSNDVIKENQRVNKKLAELYSRFELLVPYVKTIDICDSFMGYEGNKWGLANTHYEDLYYVYAMDALRQHIVGRNISFKTKMGLACLKARSSLRRLSSETKVSKAR